MAALKSWVGCLRAWWQSWDRPCSVAAKSAAEGFLAVSPAPDSRPEGLPAVSPVAVSGVRRASLGPSSRAEGLLAADPGAKDRLTASPAAGSRADGIPGRCI